MLRAQQDPRDVGQTVGFPAAQHPSNASCSGGRAHTNSHGHLGKRQSWFQPSSVSWQISFTKYRRCVNVFRWTFELVSGHQDSPYPKCLCRNIKYLHFIYIWIRVTNTGSGTFCDLAVGMLSERTEFSIRSWEFFLSLRLLTQFCNIQVITELYFFSFFAKIAPVITISNMDYLPF